MHKPQEHHKPAQFSVLNAKQAQFVQLPQQSYFLVTSHLTLLTSRCLPVLFPLSCKHNAQNWCTSVIFTEGLSLVGISDELMAGLNDLSGLFQP